jgi:hypothetical protein
MKFINSLIGFILSAFKSLNWISTAVNFSMILFTLVFRFKLWAVLFAALVTFVIVICDYAVPLIFKKK